MKRRDRIGESQKMGSVLIRHGAKHEWGELHQGELIENWERLQNGQLSYKIAPLR